jgi:hypothetical protein
LGKRKNSSSVDSFDAEQPARSPVLILLLFIVQPRTLEVAPHGNAHENKVVVFPTSHAPRVLYVRNDVAGEKGISRE